MGFSKTLNFNYENLGKDGFLILTFDDEKIAGHDMYKDYYPVVWRIARLQATGIHRFSETYKQQFLFATSQLQDKKVTIGAAITRIDFKQSTNLQGDDQKGYTWSLPTNFDAPNDVFEAHNLTAKKQGITVAGEKSSSPVIPEPILYFSDVGSLATLKVKFTGRLRIYSVTGFQEGTVIEAEVTSPKLWDHFINEPGLAEEWIITYNKATGNYEIKEA